MSEKILDHFEPDPDRRVVTIRKYYFDFEAQVDAARLREEGLPCFVSNAQSATNLPMGVPAIGLNVFEEDEDRAKAILEAEPEVLLEEDSFQVRSNGHSGPVWPEDKQQNPGRRWLGILLVLVLFLAWLIAGLIAGEFR